MFFSCCCRWYWLDHKDKGKFGIISVRGIFSDPVDPLLLGVLHDSLYLESERDQLQTGLYFPAPERGAQGEGRDPLGNDA